MTTISPVKHGAPPTGAGGSVTKRDIPRITERIDRPTGAMTILQRGKNVFFFFAIVFLFASLSITFHHHDDGCQHHECPLCVAATSFSSGNLKIHETFVFYPTTTYFYQPEESFHQALSKFPVYYDRAPPISASV